MNGLSPKLCAANFELFVHCDKMFLLLNKQGKQQAGIYVCCVLLITNISFITITPALMLMNVD